MYIMLLFSRVSGRGLGQVTCILCFCFLEVVGGVWVRSHVYYAYDDALFIIGRLSGWSVCFDFRW